MKKIFILTGEPSGDKLASTVISKLRIQNPNIEKTINEQLPEDFQTAEYLLEHGMIDIVVHRKELRETLSKVLSFLKK